MRFHPYLRPPPPYHAGGPAAKILGNEGWCAGLLAVWAAGQFRARGANRRTRKTNADCSRLRVLEIQNRSGRDGRRTNRINMRSQRRVSQCARVNTYGTRASGYAAEAIVHVIWQLQKDHEDEKTRAFIAEVDDRIIAAELAATAHDRGGRALAVERVLWRGADHTGNCGSWIARLAPERYVLFQKLANRWTFTEGSRDDVLATVPNEHFERSDAHHIFTRYSRAIRRSARTR